MLLSTTALLGQPNNTKVAAGIEREATPDSDVPHELTLLIKSIKLFGA